MERPLNLAFLTILNTRLLRGLGLGDVVGPAALILRHRDGDSLTSLLDECPRRLIVWGILAGTSMTRGGCQFPRGSIREVIGSFWSVYLYGSFLGWPHGLLFSGTRNKYVLEMIGSAE